MPRTYSSSLHAFRRALESDQAWLLYVRISMTRGPLAGREIRLVRADTHRTLEGVAWQRCPMRLEAPMEGVSAGSAPQGTLTLPNATRLVSAYVEADGLLGDIVTLALVHESESAIDMQRALRLRIARAALTTRAATLTLGDDDDAIQAPAPVYDRAQYPGLSPRAGVYAP